MIIPQFRVLALIPVIAFAALAMAPGCGSSASGLASGLASGAGDAGGIIVVGDDAGDGSTDAPKAIGEVTGIVVAPEGTIPIAGALI